MRTDFVDKLMRFIPCPKVNFDKQPKHEVRFYFFFLEEIGKRNEISSRILKNNILSRSREDEKKDGER